MKYNYEFDMKYTDNPYIDIIVNCVKILGMNAVVKNENQAMHYEDKRSAKAAADYIKYKEGHWDKDYIFNDTLYVEWNSYYRMLNGLPPIYSLAEEIEYLRQLGTEVDEDQLYTTYGYNQIIQELYSRYFIDMGQYEVPEDMPSLVLEGKYLHELSTEEISMIESCGIMQQILDDYSDDPHYQYIYHLGNKRVDFYTARKANNFSLLWLPKLNTFDIIENKFKRVFDRNRRYTISTIYSEAYRFMSYHYDAFIQILIIIQTMVDMISEVQEYIINKDVFDSRTIRYLFESYGIAYYKEIPVKYQIRIIKNVNTLLKYKSSYRNIVDILELFDDDTITVFTYYLMKTKKLNRKDFFYYTEDDINPKYGTERDYWVGNPSDVSNNKVPLTNVRYDEPEQDFIEGYLFNEFDPVDKRAVKSQLASPIAKPLDSVIRETFPNCFVATFLADETVNWFGISRYNEDTDQNNHLENRNFFMTNFMNALVSRLYRCLTGTVSQALRSASVPDLINNPSPLNRYWYKRIKYEVYVILGVMDRAVFDNGDFYSKTDSEIESYFYQEDDLVTNEYRNLHNLPLDSFGDNSEDRYILHHTIPYMALFNYKKDEPIEDYSGLSPYIFNNDATFSVSISSYPDNYIRWTKMFRKTYLTAVRSIVEGVFSDFEIDTVNNPTPRYIGWMDINYVISQLGKPLDEIELGDKVTTIGNPNIPIYNTAYVYETVTEDMLGKEYYRKNYDLCFLKVPILDPNAYKVLERYDLRRNYDAITLSDPFWDGVSTVDLLTEEDRMALHEAKKQEILNKDFTIERTKYIAVEASINLTKMSYQICYFLNMLYDKYKDDEEGLMVEVDSEISENKVKLNDLLTFVTALNYMYQGIEPDNIASDFEKNMYINGFDFSNDWTDIYNYLQNHHHIYGNYGNEERVTYDYVDEFGETHHVEDGYGMYPMMEGWRTELFTDFFVYQNTPEGKIQIFLGNPIYGYDEYGNPIYTPPYEGAEPINKRQYFNEAYEPITPGVGAYLSGRYEQCAGDCITTEMFELDFGSSDIWNVNLKHTPYYDWATGELTTIDTSWSPTQYPNDDNNSHGLWLTTHMLKFLDEDMSDLEKINKLKKIYYTNTNLYDHLTYMLRHAESKRVYDIYKIVFDSYMETKMNHDFYRLINTDGEPIYTDELEEGSFYYITSKSYINTDENGFPYFVGNKFDLATGQLLDSKIYHFVHDPDFSNCKYVSDDGTVESGCIYNENEYAERGRKVYIVFDDEPERLTKNYLTPMMQTDQVNNTVINFNLDEYTIKFLVNRNDSRIRVPVTIDDDNTVHPIIGTTENITVEPYTEDSYRVTIVEEDETIRKDVKFSWKIASDYYEYMQYRNADLYSHLIDIKYNYSNTYDPETDSWRPSDEKRQRIETLCELIAVSLEKYFDKSEWRFLFNLIPTANIQNIQNYILKMVVFFKSWKTQLVDTSVTYLLDDPFGNYVQVLDDMYTSTTFNLKEKVNPKDFKYFQNKTEYRDPVRVKEDVTVEARYFEPYWITFGFGEKLYGHNFDFPQFKSKTSYNDYARPRDAVEMNEVTFNGEVTIVDKGNGMKLYLLPEEVQPNE